MLLDMIGMGIRALQWRIQLRAQMRIQARLRLLRARNSYEVSKNRDHGHASGSRDGCNTRNKLVPRPWLCSYEVGGYVNCKGLVLKGLVARDMVVDRLDALFRDITRANN